MPQEYWTKESFWAELDEAGVDEVRVRLATKIYGDTNEKGGLAREWLLRREQLAVAEAQHARDAASAEHMRIARSAKNAAWAAVIAAMLAAISAAVAAVIAYFSIK